MLNDNAKKWVAALRSGKYEQGYAQLVKRDAYCCLGVACVLAKSEGVELPPDWQTWCNLPPSPRDWLGLRSAFGSFEFAIRGSKSLTSLNDSGKSFAEIADIIESEPKGLFMQGGAE